MKFPISSYFPILFSQPEKILKVNFRQIKYAATDAWLSRQLFVQMYREHIDPQQSIFDWCSDFLDKKLAWTKPPKNPNKQLNNKPIREKVVRNKEFSKNFLIKNKRIILLFIL